jgi:hypothetical protein
MTALFMPWAAHEPPAPVATAVFFIPCAAQLPSAPAVIAVVFIECMPQASPAPATTASARARAPVFFAVVAEALAAQQSCSAAWAGNATAEEAVVAQEAEAEAEVLLALD